MLDIEAAGCFLQPPMASFKETSLGLRRTHLKAESKRENITLLREDFSALLAKLDRYPKEPKGQESGVFQSWRNQILLKILLNWEQKQDRKHSRRENPSGSCASFSWTHWTGLGTKEMSQTQPLVCLGARQPS